MPSENVSIEIAAIDAGKPHGGVVRLTITDLKNGKTIVETDLTNAQAESARAALSKAMELARGMTLAPSGGKA